MKKTKKVFQRGNLLVSDCVIADRFWTRFRGLMLRKALHPGEALLLTNCSAIHCCFMRFTIDVVYLDAEQTVLAAETVKPWRVGGIHRGAKHTLELEEGGGRKFAVGEKIIIVEDSEE